METHAAIHLDMESFGKENRGFAQTPLEIL